MTWYLKSLKKYAVFSGRSTRMEYWIFNFVNAVIFLIPMVIGGLIEGSASQYDRIFSIFFIVVLVYQVAMLIPSIAVAVRRLHDTDHCGWWIFISMIPIGNIVLLVFMLRDSQPGPNRYGENPKELS